MKSLDVDVVTVNETNHKRKDKLLLEGYDGFSRNRKHANMGGVATLISKKHSSETLKVAEGVKGEYIITHHGQFSPAINIINVYGSQES